jgi:hypothetical protein
MGDLDGRFPGSIDGGTPSCERRQGHGYQRDTAPQDNPRRYHGRGKQIEKMLRRVAAGEQRRPGRRWPWRHGRIGRSADLADGQHRCPACPGNICQVDEEGEVGPFRQEAIRQAAG